MQFAQVLLVLYKLSTIIYCYLSTSGQRPLPVPLTHSEKHNTVVILLGNGRWPCGLGMNRQFT